MSKKMVSFFMAMILLVCIFSLNVFAAVENIDLSDMMIKDKWETNNGTGLTFENGTMVLNGDGTTVVASYLRDDFYDVSFSFQMKPEWGTDNDWGNLVTVRDAKPGCGTWDPAKPYAYYFITYKGKICLAKAIKGRQETLKEAQIVNTDNKFHKINYTVKDVADGVSMSITYDGVKVLEYVDKTNPIKEQGYISIFSSDWIKSTTIKGIKAVTVTSSATQSKTTSVKPTSAAASNEESSEESSEETSESSAIDVSSENLEESSKPNGGWDDVNSDTPIDTDTGSNNFNPLFILIPIAALIAVGVIVAVIIIKKKKV